MYHSMEELLTLQFDLSDHTEKFKGEEWAQKYNEEQTRRRGYVPELYNDWIKLTMMKEEKQFEGSAQRIQNSVAEIDNEKRTTIDVKHRGVDGEDEFELAGDRITPALKLAPQPKGAVNMPTN